MLKKNKDYVEFSLQYTSVDWERRSKDCPEVCLKGYSDFSFPGVPIMDVVCNEFDHKVVVVSKRDFEALQTENEQLKKKLAVPDPFAEYKELLEKLHSKEDVEKFEWTLNHICGGQASVNGWMVTAKLWRRNYETLSKLVGFSSTEEIQDYLTNEAECDTLREAISKLKDQVKYTCDEWYSANRSNNSWKAAAECNTPKELMEKIDGFETEIIDLKTKNTEYACKIQDLIDDSCGRKTVIEAYKRDIERWQEVTGCSSSFAAKDWVYNLGEANGSLAKAIISWQEATCCETPEEAKELISSKNGGIVELKNKLDASLTANERLKKEIGIYSRALNEWKEGTCCPSPSSAKALIESGMSYEYAYHEAQEENRKLTEEVDSWKNVTGYSTPEDYMHVRISGAFHTPFDYTATWQKATGCVTPDQVKSRIEGLENAVRLTNRNMIKEIESNIDEWQKFTGCDSPQKAGCKINRLCDDICKLKCDYNNLLKLTGYKSERDIRVVLTLNEQFVYETMRELINSLKRKAKFTDSNWQAATGCDTPVEVEHKITDLYSRIDKMKEAASIASNWTDKIVED